MASTTYYMSGISLIVQYLTNIGILAQAAQLYTYVGGTVNTAVTTYTDSTGLNPNPNPMTLNAAGRPASASGAPVAFWVPGGTLVKLLVYDAQNNLLVSIDNVPAINDLTNNTTALQNLLASPASSNTNGVGPVAGADLVANAVKSYDVFADVRAANAPIMGTGQTLNIEVQGALQVGDNAGGFFYWFPFTMQADDGRTCLKPNSITNTTPGRWLRYYPLNTPFSTILASDQSVTNSTSLNIVMSSGIITIGTYLVSARFSLLGTGGTGQGWQLEIGLGSGGLGSGIGGGMASANGTPSGVVVLLNTAFAGAAISSINGDFINVDMILKMTAQGTVTIALGQNSSSANATVLKANSTLLISRLA